MPAVLVAFGGGTGRRASIAPVLDDSIRDRPVRRAQFIAKAIIDSVEWSGGRAMARNTRFSSPRSVLGQLAGEANLGQPVSRASPGTTIQAGKQRPSTEEVLQALHKRIAALEAQVEMLREVIALDAGGNLSVAVPGNLYLNAGGALQLQGSTTAEVLAGSQSARLTLTGTGAIELSGVLSCSLSATTVAVSSSIYRVTAPVADFSSVLQCVTLNATNVVAASYSPGAGNVW